jgi:formate hydrogenlyase subunit 3/multisubunit Na+/H+ antiporter MnhD subunit
MMLTTALVMCAVAMYAPHNLRTPPGAAEARTPFAFWLLLLALWGALNAVFLGGDLFSLYVALELLTFAAAPMVALNGGRPALSASLRYLLFALLGSILYLLGAALLYGAYGTLDITLLAAQVRTDLSTTVAGALMLAGLAAKTGLFPLHLWLPPAYSAAPASVAALLAGLVGKASFFLIVRLWFNALPGLYPRAAADLLGALGVVAIIVGGVAALRQQTLKRLIAYSSVGQIGYLFLLFPLAAMHEPWFATAWTGGLLQAISHAFAKSALFLAAGLIVEVLGHGRVDGLRGFGRHLPVCAFAIGLSGLSLMGVPPSGGFAAKWLILRAAVASGQWWWAVAVLAGGLLAGGYMLRILRPGMTFAEAGSAPCATVARSREHVVLALALVSFGIGLIPLGSFGFLQIGLAIGPAGPVR